MYPYKHTQKTETLILHQRTFCVSFSHSLYSLLAIVCRVSLNYLFQSSEQQNAGVPRPLPPPRPLQPMEASLMSKVFYRHDDEPKVTPERSLGDLLQEVVFWSSDLDEEELDSDADLDLDLYGNLQIISSSHNLILFPLILIIYTFILQSTFHDISSMSCFSSVSSPSCHSFNNAHTHTTGQQETADVRDNYSISHINCLTAMSSLLPVP